MVSTPPVQSRASKVSDPQEQHRGRGRRGDRVPQEQPGVSGIRRTFFGIVSGAFAVALLVGCAAEPNVEANLAASLLAVEGAPESKPSASPEVSTDDLDALDSTGSESLEFEPVVKPIMTSLGSYKATEVLEQLSVKGRAPKTGYDRKAKFGTPWMDIERNGCDTRNDILQRDLTETTLSGPCKVLSGVLSDNYTGTWIDFVRGNTTSTLVQIDHVVSLSDAWQKGAQELSQHQRITFANDPLNLMAVDGSANSAKGAGDTATWLPANRSFRCEYVSHQISVKATYSLWVTAAEKAAMARILASCPDQTAYVSPFEPGIELLAETETPEPRPEPAPATAPVPLAAPAPVPAPTDVYYKNCTAARAAGAAPVYEGQPGYARHLDRDGDGVGCE